jgi:hypothetical protein
MGRRDGWSRILAGMETTSAHPRPQHPSSPFQRRPEPVIEQYELEDRVSHDSYGFGRVVSIDPGGATVDFTNRTVRIATPFRKMTKL